MSTRAKLAANKRWKHTEAGKAYGRLRMKRYVTIQVHLHEENDRDIIEWMEGKENKTGYIKELIRKDMKN